MKSCNTLEMKGLEKKQVINEKVYQLRKSYYDMALLRHSVKNLTKILTNIKTLEKMTRRMVEVGYAKKVDLLEVQVKKLKHTRSSVRLNIEKHTIRWSAACNRSKICLT